MVTTIFTAEPAQDTEPDHESTAHMISEFLRETAVLLFVFAPLDWLFEPQPKRDLGEILGIFAMSILFLIAGILVEHTR